MLRASFSGSKSINLTWTQTQRRFDAHSPRLLSFKVLSISIVAAFLHANAALLLALIADHLHEAEEEDDLRRARHGA